MAEDDGDLDSLAARLRRYEKTGEADLVLGKAATEIIGRMGELARHPFSADVSDASTVELVARLFWYRFLARGHRLDGDHPAVALTPRENEESYRLIFETGGDELAARDAHAATVLYARVQGRLPGSAPEPLRRICAMVQLMGVGMAKLAVDRSVELLEQFGQTGDPDLALQAAGKLDRAWRQPVLTPELRGQLLARLGEAFLAVQAAVPDDQWLEAAEAILKIGKMIGERTDTLQPTVLVRLAEIRLQRSQAIRAASGADAEAVVAETEAIDLLTRATALNGEDEDRDFTDATLGAALLVRAMRRSDQADLERAIGLLSAVSAKPGPTSPFRAAARVNLGHALRFRGRSGPAPESAPDIDELRDAGVRLYERYLVHGEVDALDRAIAMLRMVADAAAESASDFTVHRVLAEALVCRYEESGEEAAVEEAARRLRRLLARRPRDAALLHSLGRVLIQWTRVSGDLDVIDQSIGALRKSLAGTDDGDTAYDMRLRDLGSALLQRAQQAESPADLDAVLAEMRSRITEDGTRKQAFGDVLGWAGHLQWERTRDTGILEQAIADADALLTDPSLDRADRATGLTKFGDMLRQLFESTGDMRQLDRAVDVSRQAMESLPPGHLGVELVAGNLATALEARFHHTGDSAALDEAIEAAWTAEAALTRRRGSDPILLATLGRLLLARARSGSDVAEVGEACDILERCVADTPADHPRRGAHLIAWSSALAARHDGTGDPVDLAAAMDANAEALEGLAAGSPYRALILTNMGSQLMNAAEEPDEDDEAAAIDLFREARAASDGPYNALASANLGYALLDHFRHTGDEQVAAEGVAALRAATENPAAAASDRLNWAWRLGDFGAERLDPGLASWSYANMIALLEQVAWRGLRRGDRERLVGDYQGIVARAASWALEAGQPEQAVVLLEQGRGVLLRQAASGRSRYDELAAVEPDLATRLVEVQMLLEHSEAVAPDLAEPMPAVVRDRLVREWDELVERIRRVEGFEAFLSPPTFESLRPAPGDPPVVIVNVSSVRSDALLVTADGVRIVPLPGLRYDEVEFCALMWRVMTERLLGAGPPVRLQQVLRARQSVDWTLRWLWDEVAEPVLTALDITGPPAGDWPRVRWCPTGRFHLLPLHSAGHHNTPGKSVLDRVVSTYSFTLHGLYPGWRGDEEPGEPLLVAMPSTPQRRDLDFVDRDVRAFAEHFPAGRTLVGAEATRDRVLAGLPSASWVHFACHAEADAQDPSAGRVLTFDGPVRLAELRGLQAGRRGELALLLACETARGSGLLPEENISLAGAMQVVGFRNVVGAAWTLDDETAGDVARTLYGRLADRGWLSTAAVGTALHETVREIRAAHPAAPLTWAALMHIGDER
ncbi:CHAT domain-containing protein [Dactylosporangium matsuzakiense]|uniref:CHAT domain-containing protein n=1 Tax=Dactylosporangium matsuzakiense TaxID=53360 RepID=A0A9W6KRJ7_9ACTN|nr:CHAT domain-containing protein [Dactylosporangium matsuzakiense]GLL05105.1 hypothetical protein GCM10017581_068520 [Dactylosporangium matsuzakiense]